MLTSAAGESNAGHYADSQRGRDEPGSGFEVGADDYVVKPFSPREVIYRVKAILRRSSATAFLSKEAVEQQYRVSRI